MILQVELKEAIGGYWDGGQKDTFNFETEGESKRDNKGQFIKIGSWEANYWFNVSVGKTEKITLANAWKHLKSNFRKKGIVAEYSYISN